MRVVFTVRLSRLLQGKYLKQASTATFRILATYDVPYSLMLPTPFLNGHIHT